MNKRKKYNFNRNDFSGVKFHKWKKKFADVKNAEAAYFRATFTTKGKNFEDEFGIFTGGNRLQGHHTRPMRVPQFVGFIMCTWRGTSVRVKLSFSWLILR